MCRRSTIRSPSMRSGNQRRGITLGTLHQREGCECHSGRCLDARTRRFATALRRAVDALAEPPGAQSGDVRAVTTARASFGGSAIRADAFVHSTARGVASLRSLQAMTPPSRRNRS